MNIEFLCIIKEMFMWKRFNVLCFYHFVIQCLDISVTLQM